MSNGFIIVEYYLAISGRSLHAQEIQFNDIRTTLQALYALFDNCNSLHTNAYDEAITTPTPESVRRAVAIQMIIGVREVSEVWPAGARLLAREVRRLSARTPRCIFVQAQRVTPGILPFALRASLRLFKIAPGDFVCPSCGARRMVESAAHLVDHVFPEVPVRQFVLTFPFPLRFLLAAEPKALTEVLAVVQRGISTFLIRQAGLMVASGARTGAVTLIQRFGSALNLNPHLHMLFLDGAYRFGSRKARFHRARRATNDDLARLLDTLSRRIVRLLERRGLLVADRHDPAPEFEVGSSFDQLQAASVHYRIAIGPRAGRKALTLYSVPPQEEEPGIPPLARLYGFSLHAGTVCEANQQSKLERLCRYITRPPVATNRLSIDDRGRVVYRYKRPFRDGSTHVVLEPLDFMFRRR